MTVKVRTTTLDMFRRYCCRSEGGYVTEKMVAASHRNLLPVSDKMEVGLRWHECVATGKVDGWFDRRDIERAIEVAGPGLKEVELAARLPCGVVLIGHVDHWSGLVVTDHKTTFDDIDYFNYDASLQWRSYLLLTSATCFRYLVWRLRKEEGPTKHLYSVQDFAEFRFYSYPGMSECLYSWAAKFSDWWKSRGCHISV